MWKARLVDCRPVGGTADVTVTFYDGTDQITKTFNLHPEQFPDIASFKSFAQNEAEKLDTFDTLKTKLVSFVGKDIF